MGNIHYFTQQYDVLYGGYHVSIGQSTITTTYANMANYDLLVGVLSGSALASGSTLTLKAYQASTSTGSGSKTVTGATATVVGGTASTFALVCQVRGQDLDAGNGFQYVSFLGTTNNGSGVELGIVTLIGGRARYKQSTVPSM
jgi:hypothetical protein